MELLAIRLGCQKTTAKSLVMPTRCEIRVGTTACPPYEKQLIGSGSSGLGLAGFMWLFLLLILSSPAA